MPPATTLDELRFLRTLTPPHPSSPTSSSTSTSSYDPYRSPSPENTTGVQFDPEDQTWRCTHCGWEVETFDGVQGRCVNGHESDLTRVEGWRGTCVWDNGMWSAESAEESSVEGGGGGGGMGIGGSRRRRVRLALWGGGEWLILPEGGEGEVEENGDEGGGDCRGVGGEESGSEDWEGDSLGGFIVDDEVRDSSVVGDGMDVDEDVNGGAVVGGGAMEREMSG